MNDQPVASATRSDFAGMATWDGTSFSAPLVAGLIAAEISRTGDPASAAKDAVLATAQDIPGVGPALFPLTVREPAIGGRDGGLIAHQ
jgi:subtilisin family serine protease